MPAEHQSGRHAVTDAAGSEYKVVFDEISKPSALNSQDLSRHLRGVISGMQDGFKSRVQVKDSSRAREGRLQGMIVRVDSGHCADQHLDCLVTVLMQWQGSSWHLVIKVAGKHTTAAAPSGGKLWNNDEQCVVDRIVARTKTITTKAIRNAFK